MESRVFLGWHTGALRIFRLCVLSATLYAIFDVRALIFSCTKSCVAHAHSFNLSRFPLGGSKVEQSMVYLAHYLWANLPMARGFLNVE